MKNKVLILLACVLALSICGTVYAAAFAPAAQTENAPAAPAETETQAQTETPAQATLDKSEKLEMYSMRSAAAETKVSPVAEEASAPLLYKQTLNISVGDYLDIYKDSTDTEYLYDTHGKFVGIKYSDDKRDNYISKLDSRFLISEDEALAAAESFAKDLFGDAFDAFVLQQARLIRGETYWIIFETQYGENGYLGGAECYVNVLRDGTVVTCEMPCIHDFDDYTPALLADVNETMLTEYTMQQLQEIYGSRLGNVIIRKMRLIKNTGKYQILILTSSEIDGNSRLEEIYYDLQ